jgi:hypothetical protein
MFAYIRYRRRGVVAAQTAILSVVLLGFASLAIDVGRLRAVRAEAQRTADAAALAGASGLTSDGMLTQSDGGISAVAESRAIDIARENRIFNSAPHVAAQDVEFGTIADPYDLHSPFVPSNASSANAVRVTVRRSVGSTDGPIPLTFAAVFGRHYGEVVASATALVDNRFAGVRPPATGEGLLIPLTIQQDRYNDQLVNGNDLYSYDDGSVKNVGDGIREIWLYPDKQGGGNGKGNSKSNSSNGNASENSNGGDGSGNFGILNVGNPNNGVPCIEAQIVNGITPENLMTEIGTPDIRFIDESGNPLTHQISGDPGVKAGIKDALESRIGDIVGFFIHTAVTGNGANAEFTVVNIRFGRVMEVELTGSVNGEKGLVLQPVCYSGSVVLTNPLAPPGGAYVGRLQLVR